MTREEAVEELYRITENQYRSAEKDKEALDIAIQALEQEPCEDAISRKALIERINHAEENFKADHMESIGSDDGDPFIDGVLSGVFNVREMVMQVPSATPQQKTGHWIYDNFNWRCSECNETPKTMGYVGTDTFMAEHFKFCNHCGAKMVESEDNK